MARPNKRSSHPHRKRRTPSRYRGATSVTVITAVVLAWLGMTAAHATGPFLVADINTAGDPSAGLGGFANPLAVAQGKLVFSGDDGLAGEELWISDGFADSRRITDLFPGLGGSVAGSFVGLAGQILFAADEGVHGCELWTSDGTPAGTWTVGDVPPAPTLSLLAPVGPFVLYGMNDPDFGHEVFRTEVSNGETFLLFDVGLGAEGSLPRDLYASGDRVYWAAVDPARGEELFFSDGNSVSEVDLNPGSVFAASQPAKARSIFKPSRPRPASSSTPATARLREPHGSTTSCPASIRATPTSSALPSPSHWRRRVRIARCSASRCPGSAVSWARLLRAERARGLPSPSAATNKGSASSKAVRAPGRSSAMTRRTASVVRMSANATGSRSSICGSTAKGYGHRMPAHETAHAIGPGGRTRADWLARDPTLDLVGQLTGRGVAILGALGEAPADDGREIARQGLAIDNEPESSS